MPQKQQNISKKINLSRNFSKILISIFFSFVFLHLCGSVSFSQDYPKEIRGYKVHKAKITVTNENEKTESNDETEAFITLGEPRVSSVSLNGVTFEMTAKISAVEQSGKVDFLTFTDFVVNNLNVDIAEYTESFSFEKNQPFELPKPIKIFVGTGQTLMGGLGEVRDSKEEWEVTGTVFVFGKYKKFGFNFKRVIPVPIKVKIKNPIKKWSSGR